MMQLQYAVSFNYQQLQKRLSWKPAELLASANSKNSPRGRHQFLYYICRSLSAGRVAHCECEP